MKVWYVRGKVQGSLNIKPGQCHPVSRVDIDILPNTKKWWKISPKNNTELHRAYVEAVRKVSKSSQDDEC